ncbi:hypothetical protein NKH77_13150 [Streptomyces sp. M19]
MGRKRGRHRRRKDRTLPLGTAVIAASAIVGVYLTASSEGASAVSTSVYVAPGGSDSARAPSPSRTARWARRSPPPSAVPPSRCAGHVPADAHAAQLRQRHGGRTDPDPPVPLGEGPGRRFPPARRIPAGLAQRRLLDDLGLDLHDAPRAAWCAPPAPASC